MTYDTTYLVSDYIRYVRALLEYAGHEKHALKLARVLEMRVRIGLLNRTYPEAAGGARIVVQPWYYGNSDVLRHEMAHVMLWWSGLEAEIVAEFGDEVGWNVIENLCNHAIPFLRIPQPLVDHVTAQHGVTAQAVREIQKLSGTPPDMAMCRLIYDDPQAARAAFITNGHFIQHVAQCNWGLPFSWLDRIPEPARMFPEEANVSFHTLPSRHQLIGVCWG
ncbi:hypothetical protein IHN32_06040 [Deinococcus sp. 14RED07]|uniref:hypothetical protein n=1 Tax=Deinococcus sp. 14RED07 TaxID=2745874 RepID=UPI001E6254DE|nr:hypothetical protein [Deinococcus sp. 14RED07]MCD0175510.1 hypothetical protein [Deinococcus sp. 14RED07]